MKCMARWIDCSGNHTGDTNDAIGVALIDTDEGVHMVPVCANHAKLLSSGKAHHDESCTHNSQYSNWELIRFERGQGNV